LPSITTDFILISYILYSKHLKCTFLISFLLFAIDLLIVLFIGATTIIFLSRSDSLSAHIAYAHMPISNISRIQNWTHPDNEINIQFTYEPEKPIIDTFTDLKFSVQNTTTGQHISDTGAVARVVVTNGQRLFKFENISIGNDGHFSVKYLFPDDGTHQVITRLDTNNSVNLALFNVFVPHQSPPSILDPFPSSPTMTGPDINQRIVMTAILVVVISGVVVMTIILIKRR
jgi:hypothetical protein